MRDKCHTQTLCATHKKPAIRRDFYCTSGAIAPTGQIAAHVPHEIHLLGSITHLPSAPVEIAATGQTPIQVWQPIHLLGSIL